MDNTLQGDSPMTPSYPRDFLADIFYNRPDEGFNRDWQQPSEDHLSRKGMHDEYSSNSGPFKSNGVRSRMDGPQRMSSF
jgi:hypothetical protein